MKTTATLRMQHRVVAALKISILVFAVFSIAAAALLPAHRWQIIAGLVGALAILGLSSWTVRKSVASDTLGAGWLALDYLLKLAILAGCILFVRFGLHENVLVTAVMLILGVVVATVIQTFAAFARQVPSTSQ